MGVGGVGILVDLGLLQHGVGRQMGEASEGLEGWAGLISVQ